MTIPVPYAITRRDDGLLIEWDQAGHQALYPARHLRLACPCAACVEEMTGRPLLDPGTVRPDIRPVSVALVGGYGLRVQWSDGHGTGIYTFERLRRSCPCEACRSERESDSPG
jgi:ATP-binding protein involved in chromosome partitioning